MDWLNMLKKKQETTPDTIRSSPIVPTEAVSKVPKVTAPGLPHYCAKGNCHCSAKLPDSEYPAECIRINCEYFKPFLL